MNGALANHVKVYDREMVWPHHQLVDALMGINKKMEIQYVAFSSGVWGFKDKNSSTITIFHYSKV